MATAITQNYSHFGVRDTSLEAYEKLRHYLAESQIEVFKYINQHPHSTRKEISVDTHLSINNVTGRVNELIKVGIVKEGEKRQCCITKNIVNTLYSIQNIDWNLLDLKKKEQRNKITIDKKHIATISWLIKNLEKKLGGSLEVLKHYGQDATSHAIIELWDDIEQISTKQTNENPFFYSDLGYAMIFKVASESRGIFFDIEYNKLNKKLSCSCEDFTFRHKKCKHMKKTIKKYSLEVSK